MRERAAAMGPLVRRRKRSRPGLVPLAFIAPGAIVLLAVGLYPVVYLLWASVHSIHLDQPYLGTPFSGIGEYVSAFESAGFLHSVGITAIMLLIALPVEIVLGMAVALLLHRPRFDAFRAVIRVVLVVPIAMTPVVVGLIGTLVFNTQFGIVNYFLGLVHLGPVDWLGGPHTAYLAILLLQVWQWTPFVALVLLASLATVPPQIEEAAALESNSWLVRLRHVQLPFLWPGIAATLIFQTAYIVKLFDMVYTLTRGGPGVSTELVSLEIERLAFRAFDIGRASAESVLLLIVTIVLSNLYIRFFYREVDT